MSQSLFQLSLPAGAQPTGALHAVFVRDDGHLSDLLDRVLQEDGVDVAREVGVSEETLTKKELWAIQRVQPPEKCDWTSQDFEAAGDGEAQTSNILSNVRH